MSDVLTAAEVEKILTYGESGRLQWLHELARSHEQLRGERDAAEAKFAKVDKEFEDACEEIDKRERGVIISYAAKLRLDGAEASARAAGSATAVLTKIAEQQPKTLAMIRHNGFVFDSIGREPGNWQHLAFSIYTDLCEVDTLARSALAVLGLATPAETCDACGSPMTSYDRDGQWCDAHATPAAADEERQA